ncbi:hypothetical protein JB92DRAFT_3019954 [Gautieria morchelliformis]|nr:hypothetical protein JB92DRAFT_3072380 [Gautieria morchelliformis]KAF8487838.1 hypothetical protein JB92DRAFT_3019954 [Gautieria morchelliformis]
MIEITGAVRTRILRLFDYCYCSTKKAMSTHPLLEFFYVRDFHPTRVAHWSSYRTGRRFDANDGSTHFAAPSKRILREALLWEMREKPKYIPLRESNILGAQRPVTSVGDDL